MLSTAAVGRESLGMKVIVQPAIYKYRLLLLPMCRIELLGIERSRIQLGIALNVRVIFAENFPVVRIDFHPRRHPAARHRPIVFKPDLLKFLRVCLRRLKQPDKQQALFLHPELLGLQIALFRSNHINRLLLPHFLMNLFKVVSLAFHHLRSGFRRLTIYVKSQHEQHVHARPGRCLLAIFNNRQRSIDHQIPVALARISNVDTQFRGQFQRLIPGFNFGGAIGVVGSALLRERQIVVPGLGLAVMHSAQPAPAALHILSVGRG